MTTTDDYVMLPRDKYSDAAVAAYWEVIRAMEIHGNKDFASAHEGYAILEEEVDEAWDEVKADNIDLAKKEMNQVAAMAIRFVAEL